MKNKEAIQTGERFRRWFMQYAGQFAFLIILFVVLSIASPTFRTATNLIDVYKRQELRMCTDDPTASGRMLQGGDQ